MMRTTDADGREDEMGQLMTDADFERALDALHADGVDADVGDLLRAMNENRIISWEEAERILCDTSNEPVKSSLPPQTRPTEPDNDTDVDASIRRLLQNDPKLVEINLNNMKRTPIPQIKRILEAIRENTCLEKISLANMGLYDTDVAPLIEVIEDNETLRAVNVETNYLSGEFFARLLRAALKNQTLEEIKAVNQGVSFSTAAEREIIDAVFENRGLTKVSLNLRLPEGRHKIEQATIRNQEIRRILRRQAAEAARAAAATEAAKTAAIATRMADISPGKISTTGKPPTKKQQEAMATAAATAAAAITNLSNAPMPAASIVSQQPRNADTPRPSLAAQAVEKPVLNRLGRQIDASPASPPAAAPTILGQLNRCEAPSEAAKERGQRTVAQLADRRDGNIIDGDEDGWQPPSSPTKRKPMVCKLSNDLNSIYAKKDNNEAKVAYIPEAPIGRASLIAKKFEKKEASTRREAERSARQFSVTQKPSDRRFQIPAVVPEVSTTSDRSNGPVSEPPYENDQQKRVNEIESPPKSVSKWRRRKYEDTGLQTGSTRSQPIEPAERNGTGQSGIEGLSNKSKMVRDDHVSVEPSKATKSDDYQPRPSDKNKSQSADEWKEAAANSKIHCRDVVSHSLLADANAFEQPAELTSKSPRQRPFRKAETTEENEIRQSDIRPATKANSNDIEHLKKRPQSDLPESKSTALRIDGHKEPTRRTSKSPRRKPLVNSTNNETSAELLSTKMTGTRNEDRELKASDKDLGTTQAERPVSKSPRRKPIRKAETIVNDSLKSTKEHEQRFVFSEDKNLPVKIRAKDVTNIDRLEEKRPSKSPVRTRRSLRKWETTAAEDLTAEKIHAGAKRLDFEYRNQFGTVAEDRYLANIEQHKESTSRIEERKRTEKERPLENEKIKSNSNKNEQNMRSIDKEFNINAAANSLHNNDSIEHRPATPSEPVVEKLHVYEPLTTQPKRLYGDLKRRSASKIDPVIDSQPTKSNGSDSTTSKEEHQSNRTAVGTNDRASDSSNSQLTTRKERDYGLSTSRRADPLSRFSTFATEETTNSAAAQPLRRYRALDSIDRESSSNDYRSIGHQSDSASDFDSGRQTRYTTENKSNDGNTTVERSFSSAYVPLSTRPLRRQPPVPSPKPTRRF